MAERDDELLLAPYCNWCCGSCRCEQWDEALSEFDVPPAIPNNSGLGAVLAEAISKAVSKETEHG